MSWNIGVPPRDKTHRAVVDKNSTLKAVSWDMFFEVCLSTRKINILSIYEHHTKNTDISCHPGSSIKMLLNFKLDIKYNLT